jgi:hypothetical protein
MPKNIVIFSDGTGQDGGARPEQRISNIYKMYRIARDHPDEDIIISGLDANSSQEATATFIFHYSAVITDDALTEAGAPLGYRVDFRVPEPNTGWLRHPGQMTWAAQDARNAFERTMQLLPNAKTWHLFYAGPAPLAVAIGQQLNPTMYPAVQLYEYRHKEVPRYKPSIRLGT